MPFQIIRNDITKVKADIIVNTANPNPIIGSGTDHGDDDGPTGRAEIAFSPSNKFDLIITYCTLYEHV